MEIRDQPDLADKPVAIGDMQMCSTANYVARRYGVRSAMPGFIAIALCPDLVLIPPNFQKYSAVGKVCRNIVREYDPHFVSMGLDEVNMDVTDYLIENGIDNDEGRQELASTIRKRVW